MLAELLTQEGVGVVKLRRKLVSDRLRLLEDLFNEKDFLPQC